MVRLAPLLAATLAVAGAAASHAQAPATAAAPYKVAASIPLADGGWDLASFDAAHGRVLVARGAAVSVVDVAGRTSRDIGKVSRGHAALVIPGTNEIAVTSGQDNALLLLDAGDGHEVGRVAVGQNPDAAIWDPATRRVIVMNARGGTISVVDPGGRKVVTTIQVEPALELAAIVAPGLLAVNDEDASKLELVDLRHGKALAPIALKGCEGPTGLAYDAADRLTLSACGNGVAALVDLASKTVVKLLPIGQGSDGALYDPARKRFLVPCGRSGTLVVFSVRGRQVTPAGTVTTEVGARTATLDPATGRVFLPSARFQPAQQGQRPAMVPGSAHLLVVEPT